MSLATSNRYQYTTTGEKTPLVIPDGYLRFNVLLVPTSSVARIEHTVTPRDVVIADPSLAQWSIWPAGSVAAAEEARLVGAATAIRVVVESGADVLLEINFTGG